MKAPMKFKLTRTLTSSLGSALLGMASALASPLTLDGYLEQVQEKNPAFASSRMAGEAANGKATEAELLTAPQFFASTQWGKDARQGLFFTYESVSNDAYSFGVQQQTSYGLSAKVSYSFNRFEYVGLPAQFLLGNPTLAAPFFESSPKLELSQSLWRNGFGSETRAQQKQIEAAARATEQGETLKLKLTRAEAEAAYWRLALARESLRMAEETSSRARKLADWSSKRANLGLGDRSDALQGAAAVQLRDLQLQAARDEERAARHAFNTARGLSGADVAEALEDLSQARLALPESGAATFGGASGEKIPVREDLLAAEQSLRISEAASELGRARSTPSLNVVAQASLFNRSADTGDAISESFGFDQPQYGAGIQFTLPLDFGATRAARAGYQKDIEAAELSLARRRLELEQEYLDLKRKLEESTQRLKVARELESIQKEKSNHERDRLARGRSTTYQVLLFEEDYAQARLTRLRTQFEALALSTRLKTFQSLPAPAKTAAVQSEE